MDQNNAPTQEPNAKQTAQRKVRKARTRQLQADARRCQPFPAPSAPRVYIVESMFGPRLQPRVPKPEWPALEARQFVDIPSSSSISIAGIPNPNYTADAEIPCYAAVRFPKSVSDEDQLLLLRQIQELKKGKLKFESTKAHGATFLQAWLGLWRKYSAVPFVSKGRQQSNADLDTGIKQLYISLDRMLAKPVSQLRRLDEPTYNRMRGSHREIAKEVLRHKDEGKGNAKQKEWLEQDPDRSRTSLWRLGGVGSMMALSQPTADGTSFHYDQGDDGHYYSMILVLGVGGRLKLPETGLQLQVKPRDVVFFLANQQLHKLDIDDASPGADPIQTVITLWTDKCAMQSSHPSKFDDFYAVEEA